MIKNKILLFLILLILITNISACQYKINETYSVEEQWFYFNNEFKGVNLNMTELVKIENNHLSFIVYNNLTIPIKVELNYTLRSQWFGIDQPTSVEIDVGPRNSKNYQEERISSGWGSYYWIEKFIPTIVSPEITSEYKNIEKQREICKTCQNGKECLDDGASCNLDIECGSNICNQDNKCGAFNGCSEGKRLCNNVACLTPSIKKSGEAYSCIWECSSGRGKDGICLKSIEWWIYFWIITLFIFLFILFLIFYRKFWKILKRVLDEIRQKKEEIKEAERKKDFAEIQLIEIKKEKEKTNNDILIINNEIKNLNIEKNRLDKEYSNKQRILEKEIEEVKLRERDEIKKIKDKKKNVSREVEKKLNEEINIREKDYQKRIKILEEDFLYNKEKINKIKEKKENLFFYISYCNTKY
jgi:hypothetical protein